MADRPPSSPADADRTEKAAAPPHYAFLSPSEHEGDLGRLGGYRVLRLLGEGGMGMVFQALDEQLDRAIALKVMKPSASKKEENRLRFLREARAAAAITHDNLVTIYQVGEDNGVSFLAMPLLKGVSLEKWLQKGNRATVPQLLRMGREAARGLAAAHEQGLVHRDIKPDNLWLEAPTGRVKILDFGVARGGKEDANLTEEGIIVGTPLYMAPEQGRGHAVDGRTDLFSLGCVLYRLATGTLPFNGDTLLAVLFSLNMDEPKAVAELNPEIPPEFAALVVKLLAKPPEDRPASAKDVAQAILGIERQMQSAKLLPAAAPSPSQAAPPRSADGIVSPFSSAGDLTGPTAARRITTKSLRVGRTRTRRRGQTLGERLIPDPKGRRIGQLVALGGLLLALVILAIHFSGDFGTLEVALEGLPAEVAVLKDGEEIRHLVPGSPPLRLRAGQYQLRLLSRDPLLRLETNQVVLVRGDAQKVAVLRETRPLAVPAGRPTAPALSPAGADEQRQYEEKVRAEPSAKLRLQLAESRLRLLNRGAAFKLGRFRADAEGNLEALTLEAVKGVTDLSPLAVFTHLKEMTLDGGDPNGRAALADLTPLAGLTALRKLSVGDTQVRDLASLAGLKLMELNLHNTRVADLEPLRGMPLKRLHLGRTLVRDLAPLRGMPLEALRFPDTNVIDLAPLEGMPLTELRVDPLPFMDPTPLRNLKLAALNQSPVGPALLAWTEQHAEFRRIRATLAAMPKNQRNKNIVENIKKQQGFRGEIELAGDSATGRAVRLAFKPAPHAGMRLKDLTPVRFLEELETLEVRAASGSPNDLADLRPLIGMKLKTLILEHQGVRTLTPVNSLPLERLGFVGCPVADLEPLRGMALKSIFASDSKISDLEPLRGMPLEIFSCTNTLVADLSPLQDSPLQALWCDPRLVDQLPGFRSLKELNGKPFSSRP